MIDWTGASNVVHCDTASLWHDAWLYPEACQYSQQNCLPLVELLSSVLRKLWPQRHKSDLMEIWIKSGQFDRNGVRPLFYLALLFCHHPLVDCGLRDWMFTCAVRGKNRTEPNSPTALAVVCQREGRDLGASAWLCQHSTAAQVFWELHLTPLAAALIEATAVFSGALSPINGVWPDLNYLGGRSSPALNTASATFITLKDALGKEAFAVCETAGF